MKETAYKYCRESTPNVGFFLCRHERSFMVIPEFTKLAILILCCGDGFKISARPTQQTSACGTFRDDERRLGEPVLSRHDPGTTSIGQLLSGPGRSAPRNDITTFTSLYSCFTILFFFHCNLRLIRCWILPSCDIWWVWRSYF